MYKHLIYNWIILNLLQSKHFLAWWMKLHLNLYIVNDHRWYWVLHHFSGKIFIFISQNKDVICGEGVTDRGDDCTEDKWHSIKPCEKFDLFVTANQMLSLCQGWTDEATRPLQEHVQLKTVQIHEFRWDVNYIYCDCAVDFHVTHIYLVINDKLQNLSSDLNSWKPTFFCVASYYWQADSCLSLPACTGLGSRTKHWIKVQKEFISNAVNNGLSYSTVSTLQ